MEDNVISSQFIITLDVDKSLFERLQLLVRAGFNVVEINTTDTDLLMAVISKFDTLRVGIGNITDVQQLENCYQAGAHFASSLGFSPNLAKTALVYSINYLPGIGTVSEAMQVMELGYDQARPYPADLAFCTTLSKYFPKLRLFPSAIIWGQADDYLTLESVAAVGILNPEHQVLHSMAHIACF
ncbi:MAG: multidrug DMT transporter permease [Legionellales bacterium RIFCSPHIGHO2_12_FULL_35_11]|nr:MAG: multidrug DMT transporter permease [Legionellales bacterium RIFCSPHIGHO2_12_FULL_35_11]